jgi:hypothetical protein
MTEEPRWRCFICGATSRDAPETWPDHYADTHQPTRRTHYRRNPNE